MYVSRLVREPGCERRRRTIPAVDDPPTDVDRQSSCSLLREAAAQRLFVRRAVCRPGRVGACSDEPAPPRAAGRGRLGDWLERRARLFVGGGRVEFSIGAAGGRPGAAAPSTAATPATRSAVYCLRALRRANQQFGPGHSTDMFRESGSAHGQM